MRIKALENFTAFSQTVTPLKIAAIVLLILNVVVLLGQLWPEGAPAFARIVNIVFLAGSLLFFISYLRRRTK
jgi:hypothetical protein